ncbi:MAG: radical SAM protein [Lachnospiraceae bacterium]|nr:radical SAM protein [Lachnospiraceae bacterium]
MNNLIDNNKTENTDHTVGYVHSLQSMGAVDGPGIRFCVFLQGCPLRCMYCHNPDTWLVEVHDTDGAAQGVRDNSSCMKRLGTPYTAEELVKKILRYKPYFANGGGVTVSGGEPLVQAEFVTELFTLLHENGVHTCLDTSGNFPEDICELEHKNVGETIRRADSSDIPVTDSDDGFADIVEIYRETSVREKYDALLAVTDLVICDIKFTTEKDYRECTGGSLKKVQYFLDMVTKHAVPLWVRHVVVPGYTDSAEEVEAMADIARSYPTLEKIELLPFHKLCIPKYEALGIPFRCADIPECSKETIEKLNPLVRV